MSTGLTNKSFIEKLIPIIDQIMLTHYKIQQLHIKNIEVHKDLLFNESKLKEELFETIVSQVKPQK
jgi:hypothetical protein